MALKETILELGQTNSVSMPSEPWPDGGGSDEGLLAMRAGSVKERLAVVDAARLGGEAVEGGGDDMTQASCRHCLAEASTCNRLVEGRVARRGLQEKEKEEEKEENDEAR